MHVQWRRRATVSHLSRSNLVIILVLFDALCAAKELRLMNLPRRVLLVIFSAGRRHEVFGLCRQPLYSPLRLSYTASGFDHSAF